LFRGTESYRQASHEASPGLPDGRKPESLVGKVMFYVGVLDGSARVWGVRIPDLPGCHGGGKSAQAALADAMGAAREWAGHALRKGEKLPPSRTLDELVRAGEIDTAAGDAAVLVPLYLDRGRTVRANLTFDAGLLEAIDEAAQARGLTRSAFLASAAREKLAAEP
jgi:predicted RNase H-like HicB family nuclease